jgi:hypothetical protein
VERGDDQFVPILVVNQLRADQSLVRRRENPIMKRFLELERLGFSRGEAVLVVINGKAESIALGGVGQMKLIDVGRHVGRVALLQAQNVGMKLLRERD